MATSPDFASFVDDLTAKAYEALLLHINPKLADDYLWPAWERGYYLTALLTNDGFLAHVTRPPGQNYRGSELWREYV